MKRKVLLISSNQSLIGFVNISAMTLMKLNHQVTLVTTNDFTDALKTAQDEDVDIIMVSIENNLNEAIDYIQKLRTCRAAHKKVIVLTEEHDSEVKQKVFSAGCDSVMTLTEFYPIANNIMQF